MSTRTLTKPGGGAIDRVIERQMRNWEIARAQHFPREALPGRVVHDFVTVSCMEGCGGGEAAKRLAEHLGWPLFDRELLQTMAANDAVREQIYATMDEHDLSWQRDRDTTRQRAYRRAGRGKEGSRRGARQLRA